MMLKSLILFGTFVCSVRTVSSGCLNKCSCILDHRGRMAVLCSEGGLVGPIDLHTMNRSTEVLKITAPESNMNNLTMSPDFQQFRQLEEIHITYSNIPILGQHFFFGLDKLSILNLSHNNIRQPLDHNFRNLSNLKELYLDDNRISSLPSATFRYLRSLKILSIQRNRIKELTPRIFLEIGKLRVLKLSGNNLGKLNPEVFKDVQELQILECRGCGLREIDKLFYLLPHLTHLDLGDNSIEKIVPSELKYLVSLLHLKLDGNKITSVEASTFSVQTEMKSLSLSKNLIHYVDQNALINLSNITELDLGYNKLNHLDETVLHPMDDSLQKLILSGNRLDTKSLRNVIRPLSVLQELHLADMGLAMLPPSIVPNSVKILDISSNHLSSLSSMALPSNLQDLNISRNRLKGLGEDVVQKIENLKYVRMENNPWSCDLCHISPLLEKANRSKAIFNIKCKSPYTAGGKILGSLRHSDLTWCNTLHSGDAHYFNEQENGVGVIVAGASVLLLVVTIVGILGVLCYSRRHAAKYYTHEDRMGENDSIYENHRPLFGDDRELCFKFPLGSEEKRISISTIDEIKKEHTISNGT